eukprot:14632294-Ditylum_brightwellii.AAC.1
MSKQEIAGNWVTKVDQKCTMGLLVIVAKVMNALPVFFGSTAIIMIIFKLGNSKGTCTMCLIGTM